MARRGRIARCASPSGVRTLAAPLAAAALLAAGCGSLDAPDLATGQVTGTVSGAQPGARVYVLGAPQLRAAVASDGSYHVDGVPVGDVQLVVYDGDARAELVPVTVKPAMRSRLDRSAGDMPLAGRIVPVPRPAGGAVASGATFTVEGTELVDVRDDQPGGLFPLPPGEFSLSATLRGYKTAAKRIQVAAAASVPEELDFDVDDGFPMRGCVSATCENGLHCNPADGICYQCNTDADCPGSSCTAQHVCATPCGAPCVGGVGGTCAAGLTCDGGGKCQAPAGCLAWIQAFGSECSAEAHPSSCATALANGQCYVAPGATHEVGTCTASCANGADCPSSYACSSGLCLR